MHVKCRRRGMRKKVFISILIPVIFVFSFFVYEARSDEALDKNVLKFGLHVSDMGKLDPHFAAGSQDRTLADLVFNGLLRYEPGNAPVIEPDLAQSIPEFEMINNKQAWTFKLRKGVMFHSGPKSDAYELTADDVVYSFKKSANKDTCAYAGGYTGIEVKKIDRYTVRFTLAEPISSVLFLPKVTNYGGGFIVSKKAIESMGYEGFKKHPVGTGPFMFDHYMPKEKLVLKANRQYFRGQPKLDGIELHFVQDYEKRKLALMEGRLDVIYPHGTKEEVGKLRKLKNISLDFHGVGEVGAV